jgi:hypothetical protein
VTTDTLDKKIRQMHDALSDLRSEDLASVSVERGPNYVRLDFSQGTTPSGLANIASSLIANIACLKDHLKVWCRRNGKTHDCENLINTNRNAAIIHDLWNIDKHCELNRAPRSGTLPQIQNLTRALRMETGPTAGSSVMFTINTTGFMIHHRGGGNSALIVTGQVVDEHGTLLGDFDEICERAASAWEVELAHAGVSLPPRS